LKYGKNVMILLADHKIIHMSNLRQFSNLLLPL